MLFLLMVIGLGFFTKQDKRYWVFAVCAVAVQLLSQLLFSAGGTLENPNDDGYITALIRQATNDDASILWLLPFAMGLGWVLPIYLIYTGYKNKTTSEEELTQKVGSTGFNELMKCAISGSVERIKELIEQKEDLNKIDDKGYTALMYAASNGKTEVVKLLLDSGANKELMTLEGNTAASFALKHNYSDIVYLLN